MESLTSNNIWLKYFQEVYEGRKELGKDGGLTLKVKYPEQYKHWMTQDDVRIALFKFRFGAGSMKNCFHFQENEYIIKQRRNEI